MSDQIELKAAALERLIDRAWNEAISRESISPISESELKDDFPELVERFMLEEGVTLTLEVEVSSGTRTKDDSDNQSVTYL